MHFFQPTTSSRVPETTRNSTTARWTAGERPSRALSEVTCTLAHLHTCALHCLLHISARTKYNRKRSSCMSSSECVASVWAGHGSACYVHNANADWNFACFLARQHPVGQDLLIHGVSRSHTTTQQSRQDSSGRVISSSQRSLPENITITTSIHARGGTGAH